MSEKLCPCGRPLHYVFPESRERIERFIEMLGEDILLTTPEGQYSVPRHYIALHGIKAEELEELGQKYGWKV